MMKRIFDFILISILGLIPVLWFPGKTMLFGHDAGYPFDPIIYFLDRFSVWTQRLGMGIDQSSFLLGALPIHGLQAFLAWVGFSLKTVQLLDFIFWFVAPGFAMYFFVYKLWPSKKYLPLIASVIYMINFYLLQAWFVAEQTKMTIYVALPILAYFSLFFFLKKIGFLKSIIGTGLTLGILNGGGSFPLYGGLIIYFGLTALYINCINPGWGTLKRTVLYFVGSGAVFILVSAYWLFPYIYYISGSFSRDLAQAGGVGGALEWSRYLAKGSTFINLFRGQGLPEWYLNPYHAYAGNYLTNPILIIASFAFPILAYISLFFAKLKREKFYIYLLVLISLVALIFTAGPGSQLGIIYEFMILNVPGFAMFRSNFYKFGYLIWFTYAILIGFSLDSIFSKIENYFKLKGFRVGLIHFALLVLFIGAYLLYHYPFLNGSFMNYSNEPGKKLSTRITVPQYVLDFGAWSNQQKLDKRFLIVPEVSDVGYIAYEWGFWSLAPVNSLLTRNSFVQNSSLVSETDKVIMKEMYRSLLDGDIKSFTDFAEVFAIDGIVVHEDFDWKNPSWGTTDPAKYVKVLDNNPNFRLAQTFGKWKVYDIVGRIKPLRVTATPRLNFLQGNLKNIVSFPEFDPNSPLFMANLDSAKSSYYANEATDLFIAPDCIKCDFKKDEPGFVYYNPKILPGSILYPLVIYRENQIKKKSTDFESLLNFYMTTSDRRLVESKWMVDSKQKLDFLQKAISAHFDSLVQLRNFIDSDWGLSANDENRLARMVNAHLLQQVNLIDAMFDNPLLDTVYRAVLSLSYDEILKIKSIADKKQWITQDEKEIRYIFDLPKSGNFDIYVKKESLSDSRIDASSSVISFADSSQKLKPVSETSDWLYFGKLNTQSTKLKLSLADATLKNLIESINPEFPNGKQGITHEKDIFYMNPASRNNCFTFTVKNLEIGTKYLVSFAYKNLTDKKDLGFFISDEGASSPKLRIRQSLLLNSREWANHNETITPLKNSMKLNFCNNFISISQKESIGQREDLQLLNPGQSVLEIQDISVYKMSNPTIVLYQKQKSIGEINYVLDFLKIRPEEYAINLKETNEPVTLVMRETYGKFWQLCDENKKCLSFDDNNHFIANGFANGWYFKDGIKGKISLYYYPQKTYIIGAYITIVSLGIIIGGICWTKFRKK